MPMQAMRENDKVTRRMDWVWHDFNLVKGQIAEWVGRFLVIERAVEQ